MSNKNNLEPLTCVLDRFENGQAVLRFENKQELIVCRKFLPKKVKEGDVLNCEFLTNEQKSARNANVAKAMLDEIFKGN